MLSSCHWHHCRIFNTVADDVSVVITTIIAIAVVIPAVMILTRFRKQLSSVCHYGELSFATINALTPSTINNKFLQLQITTSNLDIFFHIQVFKLVRVHPKFSKNFLLTKLIILNQWHGLLATCVRQRFETSLLTVCITYITEPCKFSISNMEELALNLPLVINCLAPLRMPACDAQFTLHVFCNSCFPFHSLIRNHSPLLTLRFLQT